MAQIPIYDPSMFVWVDETGCDQRGNGIWIFNQRYCSPRSQDSRSWQKVLSNKCEGVLDVDIVEGSV